MIELNLQGLYDHLRSVGNGHGVRVPDPVTGGESTIRGEKRGESVKFKIDTGKGVYPISPERVVDRLASKNLAENGPF